MTRIIAGKYGGRELAVPPRGTRPTSSRVREAIFSRLDHWNLLSDSRILDLCAGSGALGLEALSRGARIVDLVDNSSVAARTINRNLTVLGTCEARMHQMGIKQYLLGSPHSYEVVFLDPPYDMSNEEISQVATLLGQGWLEEHSVFVVERAKRSGEPGWPQSLNVLDVKNYGDTQVWYLELSKEKDNVAEGESS
ncbi:16S rRNA (guanine(966)-N(2))-methyltransferase RsmD [Actinomycetaceae bacterium TAE3-ERU4]|nr:16S rRNA (guanine(966)-N(2))-methyltransferase RsmD [Actinomycetaceae bacterium TAE3-ERU4]